MLRATDSLRRPRLGHNGKDLNRRTHIRQPVRLRVTFQSARALVSEYTTSVSKGGCTLWSKSPAEPGLTFVFELALESDPRRTLEVEGKVVHCHPRPGGSWDVGIEYRPANEARRAATIEFLDRVFKEELKNRAHARVPVNLVAEDADDSAIHYLVRDLSRGGLGLKVPAERDLPQGVVVGDRAEISVWTDGDAAFTFQGSVVRLTAKRGKAQASIGVCFDALTDANQRLVDSLLYLHRPQTMQVRFLRHRPG